MKKVKKNQRNESQQHGSEKRLVLLLALKRAVPLNDDTVLLVLKMATLGSQTRLQPLPESNDSFVNWL